MSAHVARIKRLFAFVDAVTAKEEELLAAMKKEYPLNATVMVTHSRGKFDGKVVGHELHGKRIGVRNLSTDKITWNWFKYVEVTCP